MFVLTHIYCAKKINPKADNLFLYGSIFPDIPITKIISWELMKDKTEEFNKYIKKHSTNLTSFADGLLVHEYPSGIDRFVHGNKKNGYAFQKGRTILEDVKKLFIGNNLILQFIATLVGKNKLKDASHSFVEFSIEMKITKSHPELIKVIQEVKDTATTVEKEVSQLFSNYFNLPLTEVESALHLYNNLLVYDASSMDKAVNLFYKKIEMTTRRKVSKEKIKEILEKCQQQTKDYKDFLEDTIQKCKKSYI